MSKSDLQRLVDDLKRRYGSDAKIGDAIGITGGAMRRQITTTGTLGIETLLRLSLASGHPPSDVLRLAGKGETATLIERLYGPPRERLSGPAGEVVEILERLPAVGEIALAAIEAAERLLRQHDEAPPAPTRAVSGKPSARGILKATTRHDA
jgi:hypothetical protein